MISTELAVKEDTVREMEQRMSSHDVSFDPYSADDSEEGNTYSPADYLTNEDSDPMEIVEKEDFARDVAPARTFCFLSEVEELREKGLIKGGSLSNAVVILDRRIENGEINHLRKLFGIKDKVIQGTNGILNGKVLRFHNEPVRHKTLDLIGDLALLGISIKGHVTAARSGHESNVEFVKMIKKEYKEQLENNIP